jgi:DNA polymerase
MDEALRRFVLLGADTARLLGVDFIPVARTQAPDNQQIHRPSEPAGSAPGEGLFPTVEVKPVPAPAEAPARDRRASQAQLDALRARYEADAPHKHFVTDHHSIVFGEGDPCARLMFVGEAPGAEEDKTGRPFVGRAGQLLEKMILAMGLGRENVYICNVLKTRPPGNATPTGREAELCKPYLVEQIRIVRPEAIVALGLPAARTLLKTEDSIGRMRGRFARVRFDAGEGIESGSTGLEAFETSIMPTYHPAYLLRDYTPENRKKVWSDLQQVMTLLGLALTKTGLG